MLIFVFPMHTITLSYFMAISIHSTSSNLYSHWKSLSVSIKFHLAMTYENDSLFFSTLMIAKNVVYNCHICMLFQQKEFMYIYSIRFGNALAKCGSPSPFRPIPKGRKKNKSESMNMNWKQTRPNRIVDKIQWKKKLNTATMTRPIFRAGIYCRPILIDMNIVNIHTKWITV